MEKIVVIGGGTGSYTILKGLKNHDIEITAIVSMADDGGSTGILRDEFGYLPPGDIRKCLVALSVDSDVLRSLFDYRFSQGKGLVGHSLGNLFLTALTDITGDEDMAIKEASKILNIKGKVLPVTLTNCHLGAEFDTGQIIVSEAHLTTPNGFDKNMKIERLFLSPKAIGNYEAIKAILEADKIVLGPGDLFTSVLPNIIVSGIREAIVNSKAKKKIYVCNIMNKPGETTNFKAKDYINQIEKYVGEDVLTHVLLNSKTPNKNIIERYAKAGSQFIKPIKSYKNYIIVNKCLLNGEYLARHHSDKLADAVVSI